MHLESARFGGLSIEPEDIITFTQPIIGFHEYRRFVLLPGPDASMVKWLQSVDAGDLAFIIMDPRDVVVDYEVKLEEHELTELAVRRVEELEVYTLVVVPQDPRLIRTNLKAPLLINRTQRLGKQTILERSSYPIQFLLAQSQGGAGTPQEVSHARSDA
jgi:flagellar assembly factor FliW